jgi:hypothetical protein
MWRQVPWVANGLTAQGGLELLTAAVLLLGAADSDATPPTTPYQVVLLRVAPWLLLLTGSLKAFAASRNRRLRGRRLGLLALWSGLPSSVVWMCAPSGLLLLAYGSIVYGDAKSRRAFELSESGTQASELGALLR